MTNLKELVWILNNVNFVGWSSLNKIKILTKRSETMPEKLLLECTVESTVFILIIFPGIKMAECGIDIWLYGYLILVQ